MPKPIFNLSAPGEGFFYPRRLFHYLTDAKFSSVLKDVAGFIQSNNPALSAPSVVQLFPDGAVPNTPVNVQVPLPGVTVSVYVDPTPNGLALTEKTTKS